MNSWRKKLATSHRDRAIAVARMSSAPATPTSEAVPSEHGHRLTIGGTGSGKSVSEALSIMTVLTTTAASAHVIDPKHDFAEFTRLFLAKWLDAGGDRAALGTIRELVLERDDVSPWPIFAASGTTPNAQAALIAALLLAQGDPLSSAGTYTVEALVETAILYGAPYSLPFFRALVRNRRYRTSVLERLETPHLVEKFALIDGELAGQSSNAGLRRLAMVFAERSVRAALGVPPAEAAARGFTTTPRLMLTDVAPSRWLSLPTARALTRLAVTKAVFDALGRHPVPRMRLVVDELAAIVADVPALLDVACQALWLLRSAGVDLVGLVQSAGAMPKALRNEFENNASHITVFRADAAAADILFPHVASTDHRATSIRQGAFRAEIAALPARTGYQWSKGTAVRRIEVPFVTIPTDDERARLLDVFRTEIAPGSTITITAAEHALRTWEREHLPRETRTAGKSIFDDEDDA